MTWLERWYEVIETEKFFISKANYIHQNSVKKEYVYSSVRNRILGDDGII
ncbi:MAG: hypothetical protein ABFQ53_01255 [Patescibacteria group bacterium]